MTCSEAHRALLEADPEEFNGSGETQLGEHLRDCPDCRRMAEAVLEGDGLLAEGLIRAVPRPDMEGLLDEVLGATAPSVRKRPKRLRIAAYTLFPMAAAATLAGLFLGGNPTLPGEPYLVPEETPGLGLEVPEGQNVAVLATQNPDITVLWFF